MHQRATWRVPLDLTAFAAIEHELDAFLADHDAGPRAAMIGKLVVEEVVRNLIDHSHPSGNDQAVTITLDLGDDVLVVTVEDEQPPFDPRVGPAFDAGAPLDERRAGGMGLHLLYTLTDDLVYERVGSRNRLTATVSRT